MRVSGVRCDCAAESHEAQIGTCCHPVSDCFTIPEIAALKLWGVFLSFC